MTADRIKEIQAETAYPHSRSVQQALLKVWNECEQEHRQVKNCDLADVVCWADMNEETPNLGELILVRFPPEQRTKPFIVEFDERFEWIDGTQYIRI